jgi:hypothetical protein
VLAVDTMPRKVGREGGTRTHACRLPTPEGNPLPYLPKIWGDRRVSNPLDSRFTAGALAICVRSPLKQGRQGKELTCRLPAEIQLCVSFLTRSSTFHPALNWSPAEESNLVRPVCRTGVLPVN